MEVAQQIIDMCLENGKDWFLMHEFTDIALYDLKLKERLEKENIFDFDERKCVCQEGLDCAWCYIETIRKEELNTLKLCKSCNSIYNFEENTYTKSFWIIPEKINGEIPGFILIKCCPDDPYKTIKGYELVFAYVRPKYRKRGILKNMVEKIPKEWDIWLEACSCEIENVENVWEKLGFSYKATISGIKIYKRV